MVAVSTSRLPSTSSSGAFPLTGPIIIIESSEAGENDAGTVAPSRISLSLRGRRPDSSS